MIKLGNKLSFGFNAVQAGQKASTIMAEPRLIATSTSGKFTLTAPVSKAMGIASGDNVAFINNLSEVENAISNNDPAIVAWAQENGVDLTTGIGQKAAIDAFGVWAIIKGVPLYSKGQPVTANERFTKEEKEAYLAANIADIVEANRDALIERVGDPNASDEELAASVTVDDIETPKYHVCSGSKTSAGSANSVGTGVQVGFTDTAIWNALKDDLGEDKTKKIRNFKVLVDEPFKTSVSNGDTMVEVKAFALEFVDDTDPIVREKKND